MKKYIEITINEDGSTEIEAHGYTDGSCRQATKDIEEALGVVTERKVKNEACNVQVGKRIQIGKTPQNRR